MSSFSPPFAPASLIIANNKHEKRLGIAILIVLFLVFFEDFLRMVSPVGGGGWLLIKDAFLSILYMGLIAWLVVHHSSSLPRITSPLVAYFLVTILIYFYSIIAHQSHIGTALIGVRVDLFYVPLALIMIYALRWSQLPERLFRLFVWVAVINIIVAFIQFAFPEILAGIPGFSGLREEGIMLNEKASFHTLLINYAFGIFSGVGKFTRNLFHIFIWLWLLYLVFSVGTIGRVLVFSALVGLVLVISGKRLPVILWLFCMLLMPIIMNLAWSFTSNATSWLKRERWSVKKIRNKATAMVGGMTLVAIIVVGFFGNAQIYVNFISYALSHQVEERFFGDSDQYFWQAEVDRISPDLAVFGQGAGTSTMGVHYVVSKEEFASTGYQTVEHGPLKVWLEFGVLGLLQMFLLWGGLFVIDCMAISRVRHRPRWLAASLLISFYHLTTLASFFVGHQYWDDVQGQVHFWLITGVQLCLWRWNRSVKFLCSSEEKNNGDYCRH